MQAYLTFNGNCAEAFAFYAKALNGEVTFSQTLGESPMGADLPAQARGRIMHSRLQAQGLEIMGSDLMPGMAFEGFKGFSLSVQAKSVAEGEQLFTSLSTGGSVTMPFAPTFWAKAFGMLIDRFGVPWMVNCEH